MTINLPLTTRLEPKYRFLRKKNWLSSWEILTPPGLGGFFLEEFWRSCLPEPGQLVFRYDAGLFNGRNYGTDQNGNDSSINFKGNIIALQMAPDPGDGSTPDWDTKWIGVVEYQQDTMAPGSAQLLTSRKYLCMDLFASFTKKWLIQTHGLAVSNTGSPANTITSPSTTYYLNAQGHPGYNCRNSDGRILSNRSSHKFYDAPSYLTDSLPWTFDASLSGPDLVTFLAGLRCHTYPGLGDDGTPWTDLEAVQNVLALSRPANAPFFDILGYTALLGLPSFSWPVEYGMSAWDFVTRVCDRGRMRGLVYFDFTMSGLDDPSCFLTIRPQQYPDISYQSPVDGTTKTFDGAETFGTYQAVDFVGDHRGISPTFQLGDRWQTVFDRVETVSEPIQVLVNLDLNQGSLTKQWTLAEESLYNTTIQDSYIKAMVYRFDPVYQLFGLNLAWDGTCGDGKVGPGYTASGSQRVDYRCNDGGQVQLPGGPPDTPPDLVTVLSDLPLFTGYNYISAPAARYDTTGPEMVTPDRRPWMLLYSCYPFKTTDTVTQGQDYFIRADDVCGLNVRQASRWRIDLSFGSDLGQGTRLFGPAGGTDAPVLDPRGMVLVCALELPHKVRMMGDRQGAPNGALRKMIVNIPGLHLWLAAPNAIWDLDYTQNPKGLNTPPRRNALGGSAEAPGLLRDDRERLAFYHALAMAWYTTEHRTLTYQLRDCGFLYDFQSLDSHGVAQTVPYPQLGQMITTISASGNTYTINLPVTKVHYSHTQLNGVTTWITDFSDLDLK